MSVEQAPDPIIVFGAPRSGTTYLQRILDLHPDVFVSHEARLFGWLHQSLNVLTQRDEFLVTYREQFIQHLRATYPQLIRDFYRQMNPKARWWGDKNPHYGDPVNAGCLETIVALFPGAKFVHIVRDGRDVVSSLMRRTHGDGSPWADFPTAHRVWNNHVERGTSFGRTLPAEQFFEFRYEDLIRDDVGVVRKLFEFLKIPCAEAVVKFCEAQQEKRTPLSTPTRDLSNVTVSDWATLLNTSQQRRSLELIGENLIAYGYETADSLAVKIHERPTA